jgi:hypothetical protein
MNDETRTGAQEAYQAGKWPTTDQTLPAHSATGRVSRASQAQHHFPHPSESRVSLPGHGGPLPGTTEGIWH